MTERRIVYQDYGGIRRTLIIEDDEPDRFRVKTEQELAQILEGVQRDRELLNTNPRSPNKHIARLPVEIFEKMIHEGWGPDDEARWLNSPEAAPFRIWQGRVGRDR